MLTDCTYRLDGYCSLAATLAGRDVSECPVSKSVCRECQRHNANPTAEACPWPCLFVAIKAATKAGDVAQANALRAAHFPSMQNEEAGSVPMGGPGTELRRLLATLGLKGQAGCDCRTRAAQMDQWGTNGCREHREEIRQWLIEAARKKGWVAELAAKAASGWLIDEAIRRSEHDRD